MVVTMSLVKQFTIHNDCVSGFNLHQHIWTYAAPNIQVVLPFHLYYCKSASTKCYFCSWLQYYYSNDTLWDGTGCVDNCCDGTTQPWFYHQLNQTTQDDIEAQIRAFYQFNISSALINLYIGTVHSAVTLTVTCVSQS